MNDKDTIYRKDAIDAICTEGTRLERNGTVAMAEIKQWCVDILKALPSAEPEHAIPLSWIEEQIERLKSLDGVYSTLMAGQISAVVNKWKGERDER